MANRNQKMKERVGHTSDAVYNDIDAYFAPLRKKKPEGLSFDHIAFRCGTIVRLDCTDHTAMTELGFLESRLDSYLEGDFPQHRLPNNTYEDVRADNQTDFEWSQKTAFPVECRKAYGCMMKAG